MATDLLSQMVLTDSDGDSAREQRTPLRTSSEGKSESLQASRPSRWSRFLYDTWIPELSIVCLSAASLTIIAIVVYIYDSHAGSTLPQGVSLNAIVSVLATVYKSYLLLVVATCISQLKWPWYRVRRSLNDLQILDDASRGPLGSAVLLTRIFLSIASLGALITVLTLTTDPFLQQLIAYPVRQVDTKSESTQMRRATLFGAQSMSDEFAAAPNAEPYLSYR